MNQMFKILRSIHPVSENLRDYLDDNLKEKKVKKREILLKEGQLCGSLYFVHQGILRGYYSKGGKEISCLFFKEGEVCVDLEGFFYSGTQRDNYTSHRRMRFVLYIVCPASADI